MGYVRKIKSALVKQELDDYVGEKSYMFYDMDTGALRIWDGTPGGRPIAGYLADFPNLGSFPDPGDANVAYIDTSTNYIYRWNGSTYVPLETSALTAHTTNTDNPHSTTFANLTDIAALSPVDGDLLQYNGTSSNWEKVNFFDLRPCLSHMSVSTTFDAGSTIDVVGTGNPVLNPYNPPETYPNGFEFCNGIYTLYHQYKDSFEFDEATGRIRILKQMQMSFNAFFNVTHSTNNAIIGFTITLERPPYPAGFSPNVIEQKFLNAGEPGTITATAVFGVMAGDIIGAGCASNLSGTITFYSSIITLMDIGYGGTTV